MAKRPGNRNFGMPQIKVPLSESSFEKMVESLRLLPNEYQHSEELRDWVQKNKDHKYVPAEVLKILGLGAVGEP